MTDQDPNHNPNARQFARPQSNRIYQHPHRRQRRPQPDTSFLLAIDIHDPTISSSQLSTGTQIHRDAFEPPPGDLPPSPFLRILNVARPATIAKLFLKINNVAKWKDRTKLSIRPGFTIREVALTYIFVEWEFMTGGPGSSSLLPAGGRTYLPANDDGLGEEILDRVAKRRWQDVIHVQYDLV